jgi:hypothetical protein
MSLKGLFGRRNSTPRFALVKGEMKRQESNSIRNWVELQVNANS